MKNNEIGIVAIKLILTIILIIAIIFGGTILVKKLLSENNEKDIKTDLLYIQAKCKVIYDKHIINSEEQLIGEKITEYPENETIDEIIKSTESEWYKLKQEDLESIGEGHLKEEEGYIVNYETEEVIYVSGISHDEEVVYKLSDILKEKEQGQESNEVTTNEEQEDNEEENNQEQIEENIENNID